MESVKYFNERWEPVHDLKEAVFVRVWKDGQSSFLVKSKEPELAAAEPVA